MLRLANTIVTRPLATLAVVAALVAPLLFLATRLVPDNSLASWFVERDPALEAYQAFLARYGNDEAIVVAVETPRGARDAEERRLHEGLGTSLRGVDGIARVLVGSALPPAASAGLVARDGSAAALVAWMEARPDLDAIRGRVIDAVDSIASAAFAPSGRPVRLVGTGVLYEGLNRQTTRDTGIFLTLALLAMVGVLAIAFRDARAVGFAILPPLVAAGAAMGLFVASGRPFTVVGSAMPTLVLVIALADTVHFLAHYGAVRRASPPAGERERRDQLAEAAAWIAVPCLHTAITTAAGFAALATSRIALIRDFGLLAAAGILLAWAVSLAMITALVAIADLRPPTGDREPRIARTLAALARTLPAHRAAIIGGFTVAVVVLGFGIVRVRADTLTIGILPSDSRVRLDSDWVERRLGSYTPLEFVIRTPGPAPDPAFATRLAGWREAVTRIPGVERTFTASDLGMLGFAMLPAYLAPGGTEVRVTAFVPMTTARTFTALADRIEEAGAAAFGDPTIVRADGYLPLYSRITDYVVQSTLWGLGSAFLLVFGFLWLLARDWRTVVAAIPSNVVPIFLVFGVMGWAGIPLDIATATVGAIVLGIVVDDTIHVLHRYRQARLAGAAPAAAAEATVREAGPSVVLTSVVVGAGFAVMIAASTTGIAYFGLVATLAVIGALIADLILLPVLLR